MEFTQFMYRFFEMAGRYVDAFHRHGTVSLVSNRTKKQLVISTERHAKVSYDVKQYYEMFKASNMEYVLEKLIENMENDFSNRLSEDVETLVRENLDSEGKRQTNLGAQMYDFIIPRLVNTQHYARELRELPHREFLDLSIVYEQKLAGQEDEMGCLVDQSFAEENGLDEQYLYTCAIKNYMDTISRASITSGMQQTKIGISQMVMDAKIAREDIQKVLLSMPENISEQEDNWYVKCKNVACILLYTSFLERMASKLCDDLYIGFLDDTNAVIIAKERASLKEFERYILSRNAVARFENDKVSNMVYQYSRERNSVAIASKHRCTSLKKNVFYINL